jgi:uncharacterized metal-binding protein YceD (DUF177 family)
LTFNVSGLLGQPVGSVRRLEVSSPPLDLGAELRQNRGLAGKLRLTRTNRGLLVQASLSTSIEQECSRCLRAIDYPIELEIEEEALPIIDVASGLALDTFAEPDVLRLTDHHELELEQEVREAILLAEPIAPLCREDCPGLCVVCGQELGSFRIRTKVEPRFGLPGQRAARCTARAVVRLRPCRHFAPLGAPATCCPGSARD